MHQTAAILGLSVFLLAVAAMPAESVSAFQGMADWCRDASNIALASICGAWALLSILFLARSI